MENNMSIDELIAIAKNEVLTTESIAAFEARKKTREKQFEEQARVS